MNIQKILAHPRMMKAVTGLSRIEFDDLAVPFAQAVMENKRRASTAVSRKFGEGQKGRRASIIHVISDNAKYNHANKVKVYAEGSRIQLHFLPPCAPNLNRIERVWKFFHKKITYNQYYATYSRFKTTSLDLFENILQYKEELDTLLTENFHIIGKQISQT